MMTMPITMSRVVRFGTQSAADKIEDAVKKLLPGISTQDLKAVSKQVSKSDYRPVLSGVMSDGKLVIIAAHDERDIDEFGSISDARTAPYIVYHGTPAQLDEHYATDSLSGGGATDFYFEDGFKAGMNQGFANGGVKSIVVNGQQAVRVI